MPNLIILAEVLLTALAVFDVRLVRTACSIVVPGRRALLAGRTTPDNGRPEFVVGLNFYSIIIFMFMFNSNDATVSELRWTS